MQQSEIEAWYRRYGPMVLRRCLALLKNEAQAEEAMQDVFTNVWRQAPRLTGEAPSSFLYKAATRVALNHIRTRKRRPEAADQDVATIIADATSAESSAAAKQMLERIFRRQKVGTDVIAALHYVDGMTLEEVAHEVGLSVSGVRLRLRELDRHLAKHGRGEVP